MENLARNKAAILQWAFEHSSDGMLVTDLEGKLLLVNTAFEKLFGYSSEEIRGQRTGFLKSTYSTPEFYREMWSSLASRGEWRGEIINTTKSGDIVPCFLTITPIISDSGERLGFLGVEVDLRERKRLEDQVVQQEKLASIGEAVATLAHEIRNPLNGIGMNIYMLQQARKMGEPWSAEDDESLALLSTETTRLQNMVKSVLTFSRQFDIRYERVLLRELVSEVVSLLSYDSDSWGVQVQIESWEADPTALCDGDLIKQVLMNLIRNAAEAARYGVEKRVMVRIARAEVGDSSPLPGQSAVLVNVLDTGVGIPPEVQRELFKPFFTTKQKGLGLGLATSAKIMRQHHGTLSVSSPPNPSEEPYRTKFSLVLPA